MSKKIKILLITIAALLVLLLSAGYLSYFVWQVPALDRSGWSKEDTAVQYLDYYGRPQTGWMTIENASYYFDEAGTMCTGWQEISGEQYYFSKEGQLQTGFLEIGGNRYYLKEDGTPYIGWAEAGNDRTYYAAPYGMRHSGWLEQPEGTYYLDSEGVVQTGWIKVGGIRYYLNADGILDPNWHHDGKVLTYTVSGTLYTGWYRGQEGVFYFDESGTQKTGWITDETGRFYLYEDGTYATGFVTIGGVERYFLPTGEYILLCNRWNAVPTDYEMNLVEVEKGYQMDATCGAALMEMVEAGRKAGYNIKLNSAYRSFERQQSIWNEKVNARIEKGQTRAYAEAEVGKSVAIPGTSEHQTGLAIDLPGTKGAYRWLEENCWKYGFILRYPDDKIDITGIIYEPWHFRYVGVELAKAVMDSGLCLEEYLEMLENS